MPQTLQLGQLGTLRTRRFDLVVLEGPDAGLRFEGLTPPVVIGTGEGAGVRLSDPAVSRIHARIERGTQGLLLADHSSTNGTQLGAHPILQAFLGDQDVVGVGRTKLQVHVGERAELVPLSDQTRFGPLLGASAAMRALFAMLERLCRVDTPVLVRGETGVGKELVARALHEQGRRAEGPFVTFDCGAVAPNLVESDLFGHAKGAFTGAEGPRLGAFVEADGGTLFLDEIGELPLGLQPKLLRVLETRRLKPLGSDEEVSVNVRVVSATHRDLASMVNEGSFREDLFFRLAVFPLEVPPLRDRREDLGLLTQHFLEQALRGLVDGPIAAPDAATARLLERLPLTGNVRELRNLVERAVVLADLDEARAGRLADALRMSASLGRRADPPPTGLEDAKKAFERSYLVELVRRHGRNRQTAADEAGVHPKSLGRLLRRHGLTDLDPEDLDGSAR